MSTLHFRTPPSSVCVLRLSAVGDICHTLPVVQTLRKAWPETSFTWIVGKLEAELIKDIPGIEFVIFDKNGGLKARRGIKRILRSKQYDLLLHMQMSMRASLLSRYIRADIKLGFDKQRAHDWQWLFTTHQIPYIPNEHVMDSLFGFARTVGIADFKPFWDIPIPESAMQWAAAWIPKNCPTLILSPCANSRFRNWRNWPFEHYVPVAEYATRKLGWRVIVTGGSSEVEATAARRIVASNDYGVINLQGKTTLKQLLALLARATLLISPDSGPVHMATAVATPVIGLYATTNPDRAGPYYSQNWRINRYPEACQRFLGKRPDQVPWGTRVRHRAAMSLISPDDVIEKLRDFSEAVGNPTQATSPAQA